ncbi:MAG: TolC family protein [Chitinophagaceae bacterium]
MLSQKYNVAAAEAQILQARLWNNPNFSFTQGAYNPETGKYFETGAITGEEAMQVQQLFLLAGKRNKQISIAKTNYRLAEDQLYDLLRTLKYTLRTDFYNIYFLQQSGKVYQQEISSLQTVVVSFKAQAANRNIAETEVVRIQAQLYSLQNEYLGLQNQVNDLEHDMQIMLQLSSGYIVPQVDTEFLSSLDPSQYPVSTLLDSAYQNRTDLMLARDNLTMSRQNYSYQKALAVPDITLGVGYDKNGSYVHNFNSVGLSFDIPLFNRNQGNIRSAHNLIEYNNLQLESTRETILADVNRSLQRAEDAGKLYREIDPKFSATFERLAQLMLINYKKRNISLLEFLDFYDAYKDNALQVNSIRFNRISALEEINFVTGTNFFDQ